MRTPDIPIARLLDLSGKVAVVTGAAGGLGLACARRLAEAGASVVVNDIDGDRAVAAIERLGPGGGTAVAVQGDVTKPDDVARLLASTLEAFGRADVLVNNAGIYPMEPFLEASGDHWQRTLDLNLMGVFRCTQAFTRRMVEQGDGGAVVNISSIAAVVTHPDVLVAYGASKAGLVNATRTLAKSLAPHAIRVNAVLPGGMETEGVVDNPNRRAAADIPLGWRADPDEVAVAVLYLASPMAGYVTGASLVVDGGAALA
ncbi:MAG: SDR family oxidoreductase [Actinobacteria bacterium]|nr:SDR family oxidoreductase [Actinomycetota bacterium]